MLQPTHVTNSSATGMTQLQKRFLSQKYRSLAELARQECRAGITALGIAKSQGRTGYALSVLTCSNIADGAASQPQLQDDANEFLKQEVTSLKECLSGLAIHIVTTADSITCSQAYAGVSPESMRLGFNISTLGRMQGDKSKIRQLHQVYMT